MAGTAGIQVPLHIYFTQTVAGAAANTYTLTRGGTVVDGWCIARAAQVAATCTILSGANAITDGMNAAVDQAKSVAGIINDANYAVAAAGTLRFTTTGAATLVDAVAVLLPPVADSTTVA